MIKNLSSLSPARQLLIEKMQLLRFGRIENLAVRNGEPYFAKETIVVLERKFGTVEMVRLGLCNKDFTLKTQVVELLEQLDEVGTGRIDLIEVKHGLPFRMLAQYTSF
jgi:hypothetical protein